MQLTATLRGCRQRYPSWLCKKRFNSRRLSCSQQVSINDNLKEYDVFSGHMLAMYKSCPLTWNWRSFSVCAWDNSGSSGAAILPRQSSSKAYQRPPSFPGASRAAAACASYRRLAVRMTPRRWPRESDTEKISICSLYLNLPGCSCGFAALVFFLIWSFINLRFISRQNIFHMCCTDVLSLCALCTVIYDGAQL